MKLMLKWGLLAAVLTVFVGSTPAHALFTGNLGPASKCIAGKAKCIIKKKSCLLGCYKKALGKQLTVDQACLTKCHDKFDGGAVLAKGCFAKLEAKGGCGASVDDFAAFEAKIDAHVLDIIAELNPLGSAPTNGKCTAGKIGCITKYNACVLGLVSKAAGAGTVIDPAKLTKCRSGLISCIGKADVKGDTNGDGNSEEGCQTDGDDISLQNKDDAFVDDVIAELLTGPNDMNNQRCTADTSVKCTNAPGGVGGPCTGLGTCEFYFGAPLPLAAGGVATCVRNQWAGGISGTFNQQTGQSAGTAAILSTVFNGISIGNPCPRCVGDTFLNDGTPGGTCSGGANNGDPCDGNGQSPEPSFGVTSLDCAPSGPIATIPVDLTNTTATLTKSLTPSSPNCNDAAGDKCLCGVCSGDTSRPCFDTATGCTPFGAGTCGFTAGQPAKATPCIDDTTTIGPDESVCLPVGGGEGECGSAGPITQHCNIETFRGCSSDADCPLAPLGTDTCGTFGRECFPGYNGAVGESISSSGSASAPRNHAGTQTFASVFCIAPTSASAVNSAAGLPGPGRLQLGGVGQENGVTNVSCPTQASFLPTFRGGILDTGWTGIAHDAKALSGGKVTVSVTGCAGTPAAGCGVCTYTGPIANANANP